MISFRGLTLILVLAIAGNAASTDQVPCTGADASCAAVSDKSKADGLLQRNQALVRDVSVHSLENAQATQCMNIVPPGQGKWISGTFNLDCDTFAGMSSLCNMYGDQFENFGLTANQACCICGGGQQVQTTTTTTTTLSNCINTNNGATDVYGYDCAEYDQFPFMCNDRYADDDFSGSTMCCVCGGGEIRGQTTTTTTTTLARCDAADLSHGESDERTMYMDASVNAPAGCQEEQQSRTCNDGVLSTWSGSFTHNSCVVHQRCTSPDTEHGASETRERYAAREVNAPGTCQSETQTRSCNNGQWEAWSGSFTYSDCNVQAGQQTGGTGVGGYGPSVDQAAMMEKMIACQNKCGLDFTAACMEACMGPGPEDVAEAAEPQICADSLPWDGSKCDQWAATYGCSATWGSVCTETPSPADGNPDVKVGHACPRQCEKFLPTVVDRQQYVER